MIRTPDLAGETAQQYAFENGVLTQEIAHGADRNASRFGDWVTVSPAADRRESDRLHAVQDREAQAVYLAAGKKLRRPVCSACPYPADRVDHPFCRQSVAACDLCLARFAATERPAFGEQSGARRPVNRPVDASPAEQRGPGCVDNRVKSEACDIVSDQFDLRFHRAVPKRGIGSGSLLGDDDRTHSLVLVGDGCLPESRRLKVLAQLAEGEGAAAFGADQHVDGEKGAGKGMGACLVH